MPSSIGTLLHSEEENGSKNDKQKYQHSSIGSLDSSEVRRQLDYLYQVHLEDIENRVRGSNLERMACSSEVDVSKAFPQLMADVLSTHVAKTGDECDAMPGDEEDVEAEEQISSDKEGDGECLQDKSDKEKRLKLLLDNVAPFYLLESGLDKLFPGVRYNPLGEQRGKKFNRDLWRYVTNNMEPEYRLPTLILKKHEYIKREEPRNLGPGSYDPNYYDEVQKAKKLQTRGRMASCAARFPRSHVKTDSPDPGAYGNPHEKLSAYHDSLKHPGKVTFLQSGPCDVRKGLFRNNGSSLAPGDYDPKFPADLCKKSCARTTECSLLKPVSRFAVMHGLYKTQDLNLEPGMYGVHKCFTDALYHRCNVHKGKFSRLSRDHRLTGERISVTNPMWPTPATEEMPGPGQYTPQEPKNRRVCWGDQNFWGFNSSVLEVRPGVASNYDLCPNSYRPELFYATLKPRGGGHPSKFKSETAARPGVEEFKALSERLRGTNIPPHETRTAECN